MDMAGVMGGFMAITHHVMGIVNFAGLRHPDGCPPHSSPSSILIWMNFKL
jgi:hypothetical protein